MTHMIIPMSVFSIFDGERLGITIFLIIVTIPI